MIDFDELIDNYLKRELHPKVIGRYYPSEAGQCLRRSWYSYTNPKETDKEVMKIFQVGNMIHAFIVDVLSSQKNPSVELLESEAPFELAVDDFIISGRIDDVVLLKLNGKKYIVEVKSTRSISYMTKPVETHIAQLMLYMYAKKIYNGIILYIEKNTLKTKAFDVDYDEKTLEKIISHIRELHKYLKDGKLPPPEAKLNGQDWMCRYCPYREECESEERNL